MTDATPTKTPAATPAVAPKPKKKHGCLITLIILLLFFIVISLLVEFAAPLRVESLIADQIQQGLKLSDTPTVKINMHPLLYKLAIGKIDSVYIKADNIDTKEGLSVQTAEVTIKGIKFNPVRLLQTRQPSVDNIDEGQVRVVLSEKAVNDLVGGQLPGSTVKLAKGKVIFTGDLPYLLPGYIFTVSGTVVVLPDNTLSFKPNMNEIAGLPVPQEVKDYLGDALAIDYRVLELPDGVTLTKVTVAPGKMTIEATIDSLDDIIQTAAGGV